MKEKDKYTKIERRCYSLDNYELSKSAKLVQEKEIILSKMTLDSNNNILVDDKQIIGGNLVFNSLIDLQTYATNNVDSIGQVCAVTNTTDNTVTIYKVNIDKTISEIGTGSTDLSEYIKTTDADNKYELKNAMLVKPTNYLYVEKNGNDVTGDGSANKPYLTIQKAIDTATSGTTIFIFPATYNENLTFKSGVYLTASVKYGVYITGNHICNYTGTVILENIVLNSSSGITLSFEGTNAQAFQLLGCSVDSTNGHAISWTNTNASSKIYSEDSITSVSASSSTAKCFYAPSTAKGSFIANRYSFKINNPDNTALDIGGSINFTHTSDQIIGQVLVSNSATATIGSMVMTTLTTPVLTTNSTGMTTIASTIVNTTSSPIIAGVGAFSYVAILYGNTGVGGSSTLNGGLGAIALPISSVKLRNASLIPNGQIALGYNGGSFEYDGNDLYFTKGTIRDKVAMMGDVPNVANKLEVENIIAGDNISLDVVGNSITINSITSGGFLNVRGLGMTIADGGNEAIISFTNPASDNIDKIYLYVSYLEDLSNQSYEYVSTNATLLSDGFSTTNSATNTFNLSINDINRNKNAYVKVFVGYGGTDYSSGSSINQVLADITPTSPVTNITVTQLSKDSVRLNWNNPVESDLKNVNVVMKYDTSLNSIYDGSVIYTGNSNTCTITGLEIGKHVYFRLYTLDISDNIQSNETQVIDIQLDDTATSPIDTTKVVKSEGYGYIKIKWEETSLESDWKKTIVRISEGSPITSIEQGNEMIVNTTRDYYKTNWFTKSGLVNGTKYYINFATVDNFDNVSNITYIDATPVASALNEVANLKASNIENGTKIRLEWTNPMSMASATFNSRILFYSKTEDLEGKTYDYCTANAILVPIASGVGTGGGIAESFDFSPTVIGEYYNFRAFARYDISGTNYYSSGQSISNFEVKDETPLTNVTGLVTNAGDTQNTISWINSNTSMDNDFSKVQIYRKIGIYPDGNNDLEKIYESTNKNAGNLNTFVDSNLINNTTYFYLIRLVDTSGNINVNTKFTLTPVPLPIYGIQYDSSTKTWTRLGLASGMNSADFNSISPYKDIKRVLLTDAKVKTYLKSTDSTLKEDGTSATLDGTQGNVFSEIPKLYYKYENSGTIHKWYIANSAVGGCTPHKAFIRNSVEKSNLYIGCYKGYVNGIKLESRSGIIPTTSGKSFADFRTLSEARGTGFTQFDSLSLHLLQVLFLIQFGHADFSSVLNSGQNIGSILTTGGTNSLGNSTGLVGNYSSLYGVENLIGETHSVVDGIIAGSKYWQSNNSFASMTSESVTGTYSQLSTATPSSTNGFISDIEPIDSVIIGKTLDGSSSDGFNDYQVSKNGSNLNVMLLGGSSLAIQRGLFNNEFIDVTNMSTTTNMTSEGIIDSTYNVWSYTLDRSNFGIKSLSSYSLVDNTTPAITANLQISNLSGRLIAY